MAGRLLIGLNSPNGDRRAEGSPGGSRRLRQRCRRCSSPETREIGLEFAYLRHGVELFEQRFDHVRYVILGQQDHHGEIALAL